MKPIYCRFYHSYIFKCLEVLFYNTWIGQYKNVEHTQTLQIKSSELFLFLGFSYCQFTKFHRQSIN